MIEEIAFVRLIPDDAIGLEGAQIQAADVLGREQAAAELFVIRDGRQHQRLPHDFRNLTLIHFNDAGEWEQEFFVGERMLGRVDQHDSGEQVGAAIELDQPFGGQFFGAGFGESLVNEGADARGYAGVGKR